MDALVNASLGAIGQQRNISLEWPAVRWLSGQWTLLFPEPDPMERAILPANSLPWAVYLYAVYLSAARAAGPAGNWAQPQLLANMRASILAYARTNEPGPDAPPAVCAPIPAAVAAMSSMTIPTGARAPRAPRAVHERWAVGDASGLEHADAATRSTRRGPTGSRGKPATGKVKASAPASRTKKAAKTGKRGKARSTKRRPPER